MEQDVVVNLYANLIQVYKMAIIGFTVIMIMSTIVNKLVDVFMKDTESSSSNDNKTSDRKKVSAQEEPNKEQRSTQKEVSPNYLLLLFEKACKNLSVEQIKSMIPIWEDMAKNLSVYDKLPENDKYEVKKAVTKHLQKLVESFVESNGEFDKFIEALKEIAEFIKVKTLAVREQNGDFQVVYKFIKERY